MTRPDLSSIRRAVQLRDRCRAAAIAAGLRLDVPMSPVQANVAYDSMVTLIRDHDRADSTTQPDADAVKEWSDLAYELYALACNSTTNGTGKPEDWTACFERLRDRFHTALTTLRTTCCEHHNNRPNGLPCDGACCHQCSGVTTPNTTRSPTLPREAEAEADQLMSERDHNEEMADRLAAMLAQITGRDIGEHSSENDPWRNALDAGESFVIGQERERAASDFRPNVIEGGDQRG